MRDMRDPQSIGEVLLGRGKDVSIIEAADDLPRMAVRFYDESAKQFDYRLGIPHASEDGESKP